MVYLAFYLSMEVIEKKQKTSSAGAYCHSYLKGRGNIHKDCLNERPYQTIHFDEILIKVRHIVRVIRI